MRKVTAVAAAVALISTLVPALAQDTINRGNPSTTPNRGAGAFGAGTPGEGPRENSGPVDGSAGRSAAPGTGTQLPQAPNAINR